MMSQLVLFLVWMSLTERVYGHSHTFKRVDRCGRYVRLKNPYSTGQAYSNIECMDQCAADKRCGLVTSCAQAQTKWRTCEKNTFHGFYDCNNHETNKKCSTWQKPYPCLNGGTFNNNACDCILPYKGDSCQFFQPMSCKEHQQMAINKLQTASTDIYTLKTSTQKSVEVYCDFQENAMYFQKDSLFQLTPPEMKELVPNSYHFVLRKKTNNNEEYQADIEMTKNFKNTPWKITLGVDQKFDVPGNVTNNPCIFIGGIPKGEVKPNIIFGFHVKNSKTINGVAGCEELRPHNSFTFYDKELGQQTDNPKCDLLGEQLSKKSTRKLPNDDYFYAVNVRFRCLMHCFTKDIPGVIAMAPGFFFN